MASTTTARPRATADGAPRTTRRETTSTAARRRGEAASRGPLFRAPAWLDGPMTSSHLVLGSAGLLLAIGLVMVFSASSVEAAIDGQPAWLPGVRQIAFAVVGLGAMLVALRLPVGYVRRYSGVGLLLSAVLLAAVLVPGIGKELNGARQWIPLGFVDFQPSELAKLVMALWGAHVIALRERWLTTKSLLVPVVPVFLVFAALLLLEPDMGATVGLALVVAGLLWAGGLPGRWVAGLALVAAAAIAVIALSASYRAARLFSFLDPFADAESGGFQAVKGLYALATGGFWGVGLGNSRMKWNILPHAESDYIFAIIGEELGFLGCLVVVTLYGVLAYAGFRIARRAADRFIQLASVAITVWLIGQASINMGYVVGLLPVTGVTLPLVSAGGTSLVLTLFIVGLLVRFARAEPAAIEHERAHRAAHPVRGLGRLARWLVPVPAHAVDPLPTVGRRRTGPGPARPPAGRTLTRTGRPGPRAEEPEGPRRERRVPAGAPGPAAGQTARDRAAPRDGATRGTTPGRTREPGRPRTDRPERERPGRPR
ncbi:putative lipid II flippase FtsW [Modestobacter sp. Leaf380]|uniref:putative lipid II flippase FtsW n=1 Tax=Modestobacter sp. Leaf380 TaxID=1736356 RepID=UPI0006F66434|nr:putative lipid II flippase FtsW [Modestobacter sp. Leaf380]KQS64853.1 cell division protein FtsW [Modestobacter sp. Leaf380]